MLGRGRKAPPHRYCSAKRLGRAALQAHYGASVREEFAISLADSYRANAAAAARDAASSNLPHVKERCLRSETAWLAMAERFEQAEVKQAERVAEQAARKQASEETAL